ncbi:MAG: hypothetical protein WBF24_21855 [Xanthobacteraceae bacterium]
MTSSLDPPGGSAAIKWQTRTFGDLSELAQARVQAINVAQWLVRIANSYVAAGTLERRTRLEFRPHTAAIVTGEFGKALALEMRLPTLELQFIENGQPVPHVFNPEEHSPAELEAWLLVELLHRGIDREVFSKELPYVIAGLISGDAEDYSPQLYGPGLVCLAAVMGDAAAVLKAAALSKAGDEVPVACLPQNLHLVGPSDSAAGSRSFAFSPGDAKSPEPFFYLYGGSSGERGNLTINASALMAERDPAAAALKLEQLALA